MRYIGFLIISFKIFGWQILLYPALMYPKEFLLITKELFLAYITNSCIYCRILDNFFN